MKNENNQKMISFEQFLQWEKASRDTIDLKKIYIDMTGDITTGLFLSQLIYWHLPSKETNQSKLRVVKLDKRKIAFEQWIVKRKWQWWEETRLSPRQVKYAEKKLKDLGIVVTQVHRFAGSPATHYRIDHDTFLLLINQQLKNPKINPYLPEPEIPETLQEEVKGQNVLLHDSRKDRLTVYPRVKGQNVPSEKDNLYHLLTESTTERKIYSEGGNADLTRLEADLQENEVPLF